MFHVFSTGMRGSEMSGVKLYILLCVFWPPDEQMTCWEEFTVKWDVMQHRGVSVPAAVLPDCADCCLPASSTPPPPPPLLPLPCSLHSINFPVAILPVNKITLRMCCS